RARNELAVDVALALGDLDVGIHGGLQRNFGWGRSAGGESTEAGPDPRHPQYTGCRPTGETMSSLKLTLACWTYDRTRGLADGSVRPEGIELVYLPLMVEETFFRMMRYREFDCAEMSLSSYVASLGE